MRRLAITAMLLSGLVADTAAAQDYPALHSVTGVAEDDVLNLRAGPDADAAIVGTLAPDATGIEVVAVEGDWAVINTAESVGYAAMRFLQHDAGPDWRALERPLHCFGTEPFWSLALDPVANVATMSSPEMDEPQELPIVHIWPALPWHETAAVGLAEGTVVMRPAECSDGMSDRRYGISVDVFFGAPDTMRLAGCCALSLP